ncbi:MAG: PAS domain S-box protein [Chthoniobacterales bacterium]
MPNLSSPTAKLEAQRILGEKSFRQLLNRSSKVLILTLGGPLLMLVALVLLLLHSSDRVEHTNEVILKARESQNLLITLQNGVRGYRAGRDETFLIPYAAARLKVLPQLDELTNLVSDNRPQQDLVREARHTAESWMQLVANYLSKMKRGEADPAPEVLQQGRQLMDQTQDTLEKFIAGEHHLRLRRAERLHAIELALFALLGLSALIGIPTLVFFLQGLLRRANGAYQDSLAAAERRASELQVTLHSIGDAVVATDRRGRVEFLNAAAERLMGWTNADAQGRPLPEVFAIFNEQTGAVAENPVERVLRENVVVGLANHTVLRSRQGIEVPIEDSAAPIRAENGEVLGVILVFHDVTEKKKAARQMQSIHHRGVFLNELGESTRTLLDGEAIMEVTTQALGRYMKTSRCAYAEVNPATDEFVIPNDYTDGCASSRGEYHLTLFGPRAVADMHAGRTLVLHDVDAELSLEDGAEMFNAIGIKALICCPLVKEGKLHAMMAVHQTQPRHWTVDEIGLVEEVVERCWSTIERARAEAESRERAERFRLLSEVVSLQVWMADERGHINYVNQECVDYFGLASADALLGQGWASFLHPEDLDRVTQQWHDSITTGKHYETEFRLRNGSGDYRWFITRAETMHDPKTGPGKWFGTNTDIQDLKLAQGRAEAANLAKDAFLAALSHELRTPLTPVLMTAATLRHDDRLPGEIQEQLEMIERNIALEARLIDDLLDVTSITQGKLQLRTQPCDAHALIRLAVEIVRQDAEAKELTLTCDFQATRNEVDADPARFQQVIWNLLRNSVKFTPRQGQITIQTRDHEDRLQIEVADSGIGIEPGLLDQIFTPFEQGGLTGDHRFGGMGLGLAIARAILAVHHGSIRAQSAGSGQGATFVIDIPATLPTGLQPIIKGHPNGTLPTAALEKTPLRLLLVEDHDSTLLVLTRLLSRDGHQVVPVASATAALAAASQETFDLVISDLGLPDGTGHELMQKLRAQYGLRGIALSGYGMEDDMARSRDAGFILHLIKPVDFTRLRQALASL